MNRSGVPYATHCLNTMIGCFHNCDYCYSRRIIKRYSTGKETGEVHVAPKGNPYPFGFDPTYFPHRLEEPYKHKESCRIFWNDMGDMFGDWWPSEIIEANLKVMRETPWHTHLLLTKNPKRYQEFEIPDNAWIGTTVEDDSKRWRIDELLKAKAKVRFLSLEPLQGKIYLRRYFRQPWLCEFCYKTDYSNMLPPKWDLVWQSAVCPECQERVAKDGGYGVVPCGAYATQPDPRPWKSPIHQVIVGAQSGPNAVEMNEDWVREIRDECKEFHIPLFYKQKIVKGRKVEMPILDGKVWAEYPRGYVLDA